MVIPLVQLWASLWKPRRAELSAILIAAGILCAQNVAPPHPVARAVRPSPAKKALIDDLVLANRILASSDLGFLDPFGHVSVRDPADPAHYYMSRYVAPGMVTADGIIEYDLDSNPVDPSRTDNFNERFIHGEIYKVRPDVMAIVHSHTPELVAFSISSIPLRPVFNTGVFIGEGLPNFDIRKFNNGNVGIVTTPELGRELAQVLGAKPALLMYAHGGVTVAPSLMDLVFRAYHLRGDALIEEQAIRLGGALDYVTPPKRDAQPAPSRPATSQNDTGASGAYRAWQYWKRQVSQH